MLPTEEEGPVRETRQAEGGSSVQQVRSPRKRTKRDETGDMERSPASPSQRLKPHMPDPIGEDPWKINQGMPQGQFQQHQITMMAAMPSSIPALKGSGKQVVPISQLNQMPSPTSAISQPSHPEMPPAETVVHSTSAAVARPQQRLPHGARQLTDMGPPPPPPLTDLTLPPSAPPLPDGAPPIANGLLAAASGAHALFMKQVQTLAGASGSLSSVAAGSPPGSGAFVPPPAPPTFHDSTSAPQRLGQVQTQLATLYNWYQMNRNSHLDRAQSFLAELDRSIQHEHATGAERESVGAVSRAVRSQTLVKAGARCSPPNSILPIPYHGPQVQTAMQIMGASAAVEAAWRNGSGGDGGLAAVPPHLHGQGGQQLQPGSNFGPILLPASSPQGDGGRWFTDLPVVHGFPAGTAAAPENTPSVDDAAAQNRADDEQPKPA